MFVQLCKPSTIHIDELALPYSSAPKNLMKLYLQMLHKSVLNTIILLPLVSLEGKTIIFIKTVKLLDSKLVNNFIFI